MKKGKTKSIILVFLTVVMLLALSFGLAAFGFKSVSASAMEMTDDYDGAYRNRLAFSAKRGWNNDPNGLLYVNGTWHMYYQYNYNRFDNSTEIGWGNMSWGHATSEDLVHWTERPVAIPASLQRMLVKKDWMEINAMTAIGYTFGGAGEYKVNVHVNGVDGGSKFTLRWALKDKDGTIKTNGGKASFVGNEKALSLEQDLTVAEGDAFYALIQKEADPNQCSFSVEITDTASEAEPVTFANDFEATLKDESAWSVGRADYAWSEEHFSVTPLPIKDADIIMNFEAAFSGSAVYDENNTSGLFDVDPATGKVVADQGIVAIFTEPTEGQKQMLAYSKDGGQSFTIKSVIISKNDDGGKNDGEFRDPKVFWNDKLGEWLMVVGGGAIRMYSSPNLLDWEYLGETGYWGECPDLSRYTVDGVEKYVLMMSPEDKVNSHKYNGTDRAETYYPAEYYVVGRLNENGLFVGEGGITRLNEGIDCYAVQTWNNAPDGKVYGISWSASWKTCGLYENIKKTYNGGMTVVTEFALQKEGDGYVLTRNPIEAYKKLRETEKLATYSDKLAANEEKLTDVKADVADIEAEFDFTGSTATYAELWLRSSAAEKIKLTYNVKDELLTLDRSQSSLIAKDTALYAVPYSKHVALRDGKLTLRILLDRAFISVFADGGRDNFFSAVFPSPVSNGMKLVSDGDINVKYDIYKLNSIFSGLTDADEMILSTNKIDGVVGKTYPVIASSFAADFDPANVTFEAIENAGNIKITKSGAIAYITLLNKGFAKVHVTYGGQSQDVEIYSYENGFVSDVEYPYNNGGFSYLCDSGMHLDNPGGDAFRFSDAGGKNYIYSAEFTPTPEHGSQSQAAALIFNVSDNLTSYYVATADLSGGIVKLWRAPGEVLKESAYPFEIGKPVKITVVMNEGTAKIFINDDATAVLTYKIEDYSGGKIGLNVFKGWFKINNVRFTKTDVSGGDIYIGGYTVEKVVNLTDGNYELAAGDYTSEGGFITVKESYLKTLEAGKEYRFRAVTPFTDFDFTVVTDFVAASVSPAIDNYYAGSEITLELGGGATAAKLFIDGKELVKDVDFTQNGGKIVISAGAAGALSIGKHTVKLYTDKGRPETSITVSEKVETVTEPEVTSAHVFLWVDLAIFGAAIIGYLTFSIIGKRKKK